jgi:DNA-binding LytR/AlgR family response regulator
MVITIEGKKFLVDSSLDKIETTIPASLFFRLNRQFIIHRQLVFGFEKGENGKIDVLIKELNPFPQTIPVSRIKAPSFKSWFMPN